MKWKGQCGDEKIEVWFRCRGWGVVFWTTCKDDKEGKKTTNFSGIIYFHECQAMNYYWHFSKYSKDKI